MSFVTERLRAAHALVPEAEPSPVRPEQEADFTSKSAETRQQWIKLSFAVKMKVENPEGKLKLDMPADARIKVGRRERDG